MEDLVHVTSGILFLIAASQQSAGAARGILGAVSVIYLLAAVLVGIVAPYLFGLLSHRYSFADNLIHAALGILGLLVYANSRLPEAELGAANPRS